MKAMEKETIDRLTVAGLGIFVVLSAIYLCWDHITQIHLNLAINPPSADLSLPNFSMPGFSLDWFYNMDPASRLVFCFIMLMLVSTIVGATWMYLARRRSSARK
jgi:hypothetical protein